MFEEAQRRDPEMKRTWVGLLDGGEKQLDIVLSLILSLYPTVILVLDFIHVPHYRTLFKAMGFNSKAPDFKG